MIVGGRMQYVCGPMLQVGTDYVISLDYTGIVTDNLKALYRTKHPDPKDGSVKYGAATMFCVSLGT